MKKVKKVPQYHKLAVVYDHLMRHVNYRQWAQYVHRLITHQHTSVHTVLDVACGTGNLLQHLQKYHYYLLGCDFSLSMVQQAAAKTSLQDTPLWCSDMSNLSLKKPTDAILCLYDSINYIMEKEDVLRFLQSTTEFLKHEGLLIFDICTEHNSMIYFRNYYDHDEKETFSYDRWSHYDQKRKIQFTEFKIRLKSEPTTYLEIHQQRVYSVDTILTLIKETPYDVMGQYDGFSFKSPNEQTNRIHFVLQRKD